MNPALDGAGIGSMLLLLWLRDVVSAVRGLCSCKYAQQKKERDQMVHGNRPVQWSGAAVVMASDGASLDCGT